MDHEQEVLAGLYDALDELIALELALRLPGKRDSATLSANVHDAIVRLRGVIRRLDHANPSDLFEPWSAADHPGRVGPDELA